MIRLLRIELKKIMTYRMFWILAGLYFVFLILGVIVAEYMFNKIVDDVNRHSPLPIPHANLYFFPDVWQNVTFFASIRYVLIFPAIIVMILITNEFTFKTIRQNIVNGLSKTEFLVSKLLIILMISIAITLGVFVGTLFIGITHSDAEAMKHIWDGISFIPAFFIQVTVFMLMAFFFGFIIRNTGVAIAIFTLYVSIIEPVFYGIFKIPYFQPNRISEFLPVNSTIRLVEYPAIPTLKKVFGITLQSGIDWGHCGIAALYGAVMTGIVFWVLWKKDL
jgi:ABC-2 type transport system permease protein